MVELLLFLIFGHLLGDFVFQTERIVKLKNHKKKKIRNYALQRHSFIVATSITIMYFIAVKSNVKYGVLLFFIIYITHDFIDRKKVEITRKYSKKPNRKKVVNDIVVFFIDQIVHILIIYLVLLLLKLLGKTLEYHNLITINQIIMLNFVVIASFVCGPIVGMFLEFIYKNCINYKSSINNHKSTTSTTTTCKISQSTTSEKTTIEKVSSSQLKRVKVGTVIGIIERGIIIVVLMNFGKDSFPIIGTILAIKSITRFKSMDDKNFSEYYLLGTTLSYFMVIIVYLFYLEMSTSLRKDSLKKNNSLKKITMEFEHNETRISKYSLKDIEEEKIDLKKIDYILVISSTDSTGSDSINREIGSKRQSEMIKYLVEKGIEKEKIKSVYLKGGLTPSKKSEKNHRNRMGQVLIFYKT